jgi:hypothetical protein
VNPANPVVEIWRGKWTPADYQARTVTFSTQKALAATTGVQLYLANPQGQLISHHVALNDITWGSVQIPIPSPASWVLVVFAGTFAARRERRASSGDQR